MKKLLLIIVILIFSVSGCAMQSEFVDLENEVNRMKVILLQTQRDMSNMQQAQQSKDDDKTVQDINDRFSRLESQNSGTIDMLQKNQADFEGRLTQLATDVQIIQGGVEENSHRVTELTESSDDHDAAIQELSRRLDSLEAPAGAEGHRQQDLMPAPAPPVQQPGQQPAQSTTERPPGAASPSPSEQYSQAYKDYMAGHYDPAIEGFYSYLRQSPTGNLAPNALYWIGECYYSKGDYTKSVTVFESVTIDYPRSEKVAGSLLKMGYGYEKLNNSDMAKLYFRKVAEQFPYSQEASLAKVRLSEIK